MNTKSPALIALRTASINASHKGFPREAQAIALRALELAERTTGSDSSDYYQCAQEAALRSLENGDYSKAEQCQYIVLAQVTNLFGEEHVRFAEQLRLLADILRDGGNEIGAKSAEKQAAIVLARIQLAVQSLST